VIVRILVPGVAQPGGSKRAFVVAGKARVTDANAKAKPWQADCKVFAAQAMAGREPMRGPVRVTMRFYRQRPKSHYTPTGNLTKAALRAATPTSKPDVLKLARAAEDALTGIVWADDAQIVSELIEKRWGAPHAEILVAELAEGCGCSYALTMQARAGCAVHGIDGSLGQLTTEGGS